MFRGLIKRHHLLITVWAVGFLLLGSNLALASYFQDRIYPGVKIGSVYVGGMTRAQARDHLKKELDGYKLLLKVDTKSYLVSPDQFGAKYEIDVTVDTAFRQGRRHWLPMLGLWEAGQQRSLTYAYSIDSARLKEYANKLSTSQVQAPADAEVRVANGKVEVQADKSGLAITAQQLTKAISEGIDNQAAEVVVSRQPVAAEVRLASAEQAAQAARQILGAQLTLSYQDKTFKPNAEQIGAWLKFTKDGSQLLTEVDLEKVKAYVKSVAASVNIAPVTKNINVVNGQVKAEEGGKEGLAVDEVKLAESLAAAAKSAAVAKLDVPTRTVAFKTVYNRTVELTAGRYIEVNLSSQRLWAYQDHQVAYESPITSGATGAGFPTVQGLFSIYSKQQNRYLNGYSLGYNYNVFVKYWMAFHRDFGLHDASWRGTYGGSDYYYNGSHGCVNLPEATAAWIYGWADIGTPIWVHS